MKQIFLLRKGGKYAGYVGKTEQDDRKASWDVAGIGDPLPPLEQWEAPMLTQYLGDGKKPRKPKKVGDAASSGRPLLISQRAADALSDIWERHALLYPVRLDNAQDMYYMVIVQTTLDCLDEASSRVARNKLGICSVYEWEFKNGITPDEDVFILPYNKTAIYVSEVFKERVVKAKLKGFAFLTNFFDPKPFVS